MEKVIVRVDLSSWILHCKELKELNDAEEEDLKYFGEI